MTYLRNPFIYIGVVVLAMWYVALTTTTPEFDTYEPPELVYSFPPNCPEVESLASFPPEEIDRMAGSLGLRKIMQGLYYMNDVGACFVPAQIPVLYENREVYQRELQEHWKSGG